MNNEYQTPIQTLISLKVQEGNVIWHKNVKIPSYHSIYEILYKFQKIFWLGLFG